MDLLTWVLAPLAAAGVWFGGSRIVQEPHRRFVARHTDEVHDVAAALRNRLANMFTESLVLPMPPNLASHNPDLLDLWQRWTEISGRYQQTLRELCQQVERDPYAQTMKGNEFWHLSERESLRELPDRERWYVTHNGMSCILTTSVERDYQALGTLKDQLIQRLDTAAVAPLHGTCPGCKDWRWYRLRQPTV